MLTSCLKSQSCAGENFLELVEQREEPRLRRCRTGLWRELRDCPAEDGEPKNGGLRDEQGVQRQKT